MASKKEKKAAKKASQKAGKKNPKTSSKSRTSNKKFDFKSLWPLIAILAFTALCFSTAINNEFVNWDDDKNIYENDNITTLNDENFWSNTKKIFTSPIIGGYNPLSVWTFAIEHQLYGIDNPRLWHLDNVILHLLCTLLIFFIGKKLNLSFWPNILFTLLFAIHPMRVESVAWVTERKDVLFGFFYLLGMLYYLKYIIEDKKKKYLAVVWICFVLSLFSKIQAVIFPISLVLLDYYYGGKLDFKKILQKAPFFIGSLLFGILGLQFLGEQGSFESNDTYSGPIRIFIGAWQYTIYLIKSIVPFRLSPLYPYPSSIPWYFYLSSLSFIGTAIGLWVAYKKEWKVLFFGLAFFLANVFFMLQILAAGQGFLADRFTYIAYVGLFFIYASGFQKLQESKPNLKLPILVGTGVVVLVYSFMTYNQNKIWKNSGTLWSHVLKYYKNSTLPYGNRANYYRDNGQKTLALKDYNDRIKLKANDAAVFNSRARLFFNSSNRDTLMLALQDYNKAIELKADDAEYHVNRGATYAKLNNMDMALVNLNEGIRLDPSFTNAYLNRSVIYNQRGEYALALQDINKYLEFKPYNGDLWYEKSRLHNATNQAQEGLIAAQRALKLNNKPLYLVEKAKSQFMLGKVNEARQDLQSAIQSGVKVNQNVINQIMGGN